MKQVYDYNAQISFVKEFMKGGIRTFSLTKAGRVGCFDMELGERRKVIRVTRHQKGQVCRRVFKPSSRLISDKE